MLHLDFTDFSLIEQLVMPELPGCPRATIAETSVRVFSDLCESTHCYREHIDFTVTADVADYDLVAPHQNTVVIGVSTVVLNSESQLPGNYIADAPGRITFEDGQAGGCRVTAILKPLLNATSAPTDLLSRWAGVVADGVKGKLMLIPGAGWSNPQMAAYYSGLYDAAVLKIGADVRNQFSVARTGRAPYKRSVYGV